MEPNFTKIDHHSGMLAIAIATESMGFVGAHGMRPLDADPRIHPGQSFTGMTEGLEIHFTNLSCETLKMCIGKLACAEILTYRRHRFIRKQLHGLYNFFLR